MSLAVFIASSPQLCFHDGTPPTGAPPLSYGRLISVPTIFAEAPVGGGGENMSGQILLANSDGAITALIKIPPIGSVITIKKDNVTIMTGTISRITISDIINITVEG